MPVTDISPLVNDLESDNKRKVSQTMEQLKGMGPAVVPALIEALGNRTGLAIKLDPLARRFDQPGSLSMVPPNDPLSQRVELVLLAIGTGALPRLAKGLDHPDLRVRQAAARVMARQGAAAVEFLVPGLANPRAHYLVMDALVNIGEPAVDALAAYLRTSPTSSLAWNIADLGLCTILGLPTRHGIKAFKNGLTAAWISGLAAASIFLFLGLLINLGWVVSVLVGLLVGYVVWGAVVSSTGLSSEDDDRSFFTMLKEMLSAAAQYPRKIVDFKKHVADRKQLCDRYILPE